MKEETQSLTSLWQVNWFRCVYRIKRRSTKRAELAKLNLFKGSSFLVRGC